MIFKIKVMQTTMTRVSQTLTESMAQKTAMTVISDETSEEYSGKSSGAEYPYRWCNAHDVAMGVGIKIPDRSVCIWENIVSRMSFKTPGRL